MADWRQYDVKSMPRRLRAPTNQLIEAGLQSDDTAIEIGRGIFTGDLVPYRLGAHIARSPLVETWESPFLDGPFGEQAEVFYFSPVRNGSEIPTREVGYFAHAFGRQAMVSTIVPDSAVTPLLEVADVANSESLRYGARVFAHDLLDAAFDSMSDSEAVEANPAFTLEATAEELHLILGGIQSAQNPKRAMVFVCSVTPE